MQIIKKLERVSDHMQFYDPISQKDKIFFFLLFVNLMVIASPGQLTTELFHLTNDIVRRVLAALLMK